jgi:hypothetical protein
MSIWQQGFFERPGITAIHLLPREVYDAMLPIKITPKPVNMVRVGVAIHANLEGAPSIRNQALGLIELLNDDDFKVREKATRQLIHLGPLGLKYVQQALTRPPSEEVKDRCEQIIEAVDTTSWFKDALKKKE